MSSLKQLLSDIELMYEHKEAYKRLAIKYKVALEEIYNMKIIDEREAFDMKYIAYNALNEGDEQ